MRDLQCTKTSQYSDISVEIYTTIKNVLHGDILPNGTDTIFWSDQGDFLAEVYGNSFISDSARRPLCLFAIVLSIPLIKDELTLLSVLIHEISQGVQHLNGDVEPNHGPCFKKVAKDIIKDECDSPGTAS